MRNRKIDKNLQFKIIKYLDFVQKREKNTPELALKIINKVSKKLREELY